MAGMRLRIVPLTSATPATYISCSIMGEFPSSTLGAPFSVPGGLTANQLLYLLTSRSVLLQFQRKPLASFSYSLQSNLTPSKARTSQALVVPEGQMRWQWRPPEQWLLLPAVGLAWIHLGTRGGGQAVVHQDTQAGSCHRTAARCGFGAQAGLDSTLF